MLLLLYASTLFCHVLPPHQSLSSQATRVLAKAVKGERQGDHPVYQYVDIPPPPCPTTNRIIFVLEKWEQLCVNPQTLEIMWHGNHLNCLSKEKTHTGSSVGKINAHVCVCTSLLDVPVYGCAKPDQLDCCGALSFYEWNSPSGLIWLLPLSHSSPPFHPSPLPPVGHLRTQRQVHVHMYVCPSLFGMRHPVRRLQHRRRNG